jgi:hypothetical protein
MNIKFNQQTFPKPNIILRLPPLFAYILYKEIGILKTEKMLLTSKIPSTNENLFLLRSWADINFEKKKANEPKKNTKKKNYDIFITPIATACKQFIKATMHIQNPHVDVAWIGLHPKFLYKGTNNNPPPNPKPLSIPAPKLFIKTYLVCY